MITLCPCFTYSHYAFKTYIFKPILSLTNVHFLYSWSFDFEMWTWLYRERFPLFVRKCYERSWPFAWALHERFWPIHYLFYLTTVLKRPWNVYGTQTVRDNERPGTLDGPKSTQNRVYGTISIQSMILDDLYILEIWPLS